MFSLFLLAPFLVALDPAAAGRPTDNLAFDDGGTLWVLDVDARSLYRLEGDALVEVVRHRSETGHLHRIAPAPGGGIWVAGSAANVGDDGRMPEDLEVHHVDAAGAFTPVKPVPERFHYFGPAAVGPDGALVRSRFGRGLEVRLPDGTVADLVLAGEEPGAYGKRVRKNGDRPWIGAVAPCGADVLFVDMNVGGLWRLDPAGQVELVREAGPQRRFNAVECDASNRTWVGVLDHAGSTWTVARLEGPDLLPVASVSFAGKKKR